MAADTKQSASKTKAKFNCGMNCISYIIVAMNALYVIVGIVTIAIGIWAHYSMSHFQDYAPDHLKTLPVQYLIIVTGCLILLLGVLGCCCICRRETMSNSAGNCCFLLLLGLIVIVLIFEMATILYVMISKNAMNEGFQVGFSDAMNTYEEDSSATTILDTAQSTGGCCGRLTYNEWFNTTWGTKNGGNKVPESCCKEPDVENCGEIKGADQSQIYTQGCMSKMSEFLTSKRFIIGAVIVLIIITQIVQIVLTCMIKKLYHQTKNNTTDGQEKPDPKKEKKQAEKQKEQETNRNKSVARQEEYKAKYNLN